MPARQGMFWRIEETRQAHFEIHCALVLGSSLSVKKSQNIVPMNLQRCYLLGLP
jgi:hypothetical protein